MSTLLFRLAACVVGWGVTTTAVAAPSSPWPFPPKPQQQQATDPGGLTVTFWNIQWFPGGRPAATRPQEEAQIQAVHREITALRCDVIGMEEVRDFKSAELAVQPLPGFKVDVCSNFPPREGQQESQQVAIASRLQPISAWSEFWQSTGPVAPPRGFAFAAYQLGPRQLLLVYALHLKSNRGDARENIKMREESARQLMSHVQAMNQAYSSMGQITWAIGGDFNTSPDDKQFAGEQTTKILTDAGFQWGWQNVAAPARLTYGPEKQFPGGTFDHVFYKGATLRSAWLTKVPAQASDHRPVSVSLALPAGP